MRQAIERGDHAALAKWVLEGSSTHVRQMAARAVSEADQLRELIRATRGGNDKSVYRILTAKRDAALAEARSAQQRQAEVEAVAAAISRHSERTYDALYEATLEQLEVRWRAQASHASTELRGEVARRLEQAREVVATHRRVLDERAEQQRAAALAAAEARHQHELAARAAAEAAAEQARAVATEREAERTKREAEEAQVRDLLGLLRQAQAALDRGGTARAARLRDSIREKLPQAPALPAWFERKLQEVESRIGELKDWKSFTVEPKRTELLQRMQSLVGADISPEELARQIRRLRDEWRTLNRGAGEDPSPEWQQFNEAAERAYEPCREHFARQAELRKLNQEHREALLERLQGFAAELGSEAVNWRAVQQVIAESRREWQSYAPVDQAVAKTLQARFHALMDGLHARLEAEYARNVEAKRGLIARAAGLAELPDTRQAIEEAKNLQRTWKTVGVVPHHQDRALWDEFRRHCDDVFQRSSRESAAYAAGLEANLARATAVCDELEQLARQSGESLQSSLHRQAELRAEFDSLDLPRPAARDLQLRFSKATAACHEAVRQQRIADARRGWTDLFAAAAQVRAYALAVALQRAPTDCEALRRSAESAVAGLAETPKGGRESLERQLARVTAGELSADLARNELALRLLCIRAELIADHATPPEDLELRREYQMQRLVRSMGRGERDTPGQFGDLALEWIAAGPVEASIHDGLFARFERCRAACER